MALIIGIILMIIFYFSQFVIFLPFILWVGGFVAGSVVGYLMKDWFRGIVGALVTTLLGSSISGGLFFAYQLPHVVGMGLASGFAAYFYAYIPIYAAIGGISGVLIAKRQQSG